MRTKVRHASPPKQERLTAKVRRLPAVHPGEVFSEELMTPLGLRINGLARDLRVPVARVSEIVNGRRSITADTALRLARYFAMSPYFWMNLQAAYDLDVATRASADRSSGTCILGGLCSPPYCDWELCKCRECEMSRPVTSRTADASTVATAAVWPSSVMNSISKALPSA